MNNLNTQPQTYQTIIQQNNNTLLNKLQLQQQNVPSSNLQNKSFQSTQKPISPIEFKIHQFNRHYKNHFHPTHSRTNGQFSSNTKQLFQRKCPINCQTRYKMQKYGNILFMIENCVKDQIYNKYANYDNDRYNRYENTCHIK